MTAKNTCGARPYYQMPKGSNPIGLSYAFGGKKLSSNQLKSRTKSGYYEGPFICPHCGEHIKTLAQPDILVKWNALRGRAGYGCGKCGTLISVAPLTGGNMFTFGTRFQGNLPMQRNFGYAPVDYTDNHIPTPGGFLWENNPLDRALNA